jgi:hypothetical protein
MFFQGACTMENWSTVAKILVGCSGLSLLFSFYSLLFSSISARATVATVQHAQQRKRFNIYVHSVAVSLVLVTTGYLGFLYFSNSPSASANSSQLITATCPCPEVQGKENPLSQPQTSPTPSLNSVEVQAVPPKKSTNFLIDAIRYDYSHNALMGRFSGTLSVQNGNVKFVIANPVFRLAGRHQIWGQRTITGIKIGIADYDELIKVSRGREGAVIWSDPFQLTATRDHGEEYAENKTIEISIAVGKTDLKGKAVIVQIDNELTSCGNTLESSYAMSGTDIFY